MCATYTLNEFLKYLSAVGALTAVFLRPQAEWGLDLQQEGFWPMRLLTKQWILLRWTWEAEHFV